MDYLPKDPAILVSSVNMLLREGRSPRDYRVSRGGEPEFDTLESLCYNFGAEPKDIKDFHRDHKRFEKDITEAVKQLESML